MFNNRLRIKHLDIKTITILILSIVCIGLLVNTFHDNKKNTTEHFLNINSINSNTDGLDINSFKTKSFMNKIRVFLKYGNTFSNVNKKLTSDIITDEMKQIMTNEIKQIMTNEIKQIMTNEMKQMMINEIVPIIGSEMRNTFCNTECPEEEQDEEAEEEERIMDEQQNKKHMAEIMANLYADDDGDDDDGDDDDADDG